MGDFQFLLPHSHLGISFCTRTVRLDFASVSFHFLLFCIDLFFTCVDVYILLKVDSFLTSIESSIGNVYCLDVSSMFIKLMDIVPFLRSYFSNFLSMQCCHQFDSAHFLVLDNGDVSTDSHNIVIERRTIDCTHDILAKVYNLTQH